MGLNAEWQIIFNYPLCGEGSAQAVWDEVFRVALQYKAKKLGVAAVEATAQSLTEAIFNLTDHDQIDIAGKTINGQKVKEIFITTIFLKYLETKFKEGDHVFLVIPREETSSDTAIMIAPKDAPAKALNEKQIKLTQNHFPYQFQVKEYFNFQRMQQEDLEIRDFTSDCLEKTLKNKKYSELILIYIRDLMNYKSEQIEEFFSNHPNSYLISATNHIEVDDKEIALDSSQYNFVISFPDGHSMYHAIFNRPRSLVNTEQATLILGYNPGEMRH